MTFQFDSEIAAEYGLNEAVFIHNIYFWINHNEANQKHFYLGRYWTYNTKNAFTDLFPFWSYSQVKNIIKKLKQNSVLMVDNFNDNTWDRTMWYSVSDEIINHYKSVGKVNKNALVKNKQCIVQISPIQSSELTNRLAKNEQSNIGTDNKPDSKTQIEGALSFLELNFPSEYERLMMQFRNQINDWNRFEQLFEARVEKEGLKFELNVISGRFKEFALNWIHNQDKFDGVIELNPQPASTGYMKKKLS